MFKVTLQKVDIDSDEPLSEKYEASFSDRPTKEELKTLLYNNFKVDENNLYFKEVCNINFDDLSKIKITVEDCSNDPNSNYSLFIKDALNKIFNKMSSNISANRINFNGSEDFFYKKLLKEAEGFVKDVFNKYSSKNPKLVEVSHVSSGISPLSGKKFCYAQLKFRLDDGMHLLKDFKVIYDLEEELFCK